MYPQDTTQHPKYNFVDLTGQRFGRLTVICRSKTINGTTKWLCRCDCGNEKIINAANLKKGATSSCGCLQKERAINASRTHGMSDTRIYYIWSSMIARCYNKNSSGYALYGAKGITMSDEWRNSFETFYSDMGDYPTPRHTIDRIDPRKPYCKENCRWATMREQQNNRTNNRLFFRNGESFTAAEWERRTGIPASTIRRRILVYKWTVERALTTPVQKKHKRKNHP